MAFGLPPWYITVFTCLTAYVAKQKNNHDQDLFKFPNPTLNETYDFIIVGGGSAGSVLANRLSEIKEWNILLVEAGGEEDIISETPSLVVSLWNSDKDWNYTTVEQKHACKGNQGKCPYTAGHVLGGGSSINAMNYVRGNKFDYENWKSQGNEGWGYEDVLPYFLKSENIRIKELTDSKYHSTSGYQSVDRNRYDSLVGEDLIKAGQELGYQYGDYNGENQNTVSYLQYTMRDGTRCSTSKAFLSVIKNRPNIHISQRTYVLAINLNENNDRVEGVKLIKDGKTLDIKAKKEVILSAGAIHSPKLLMLSGIGPKNHLKEIGITPKIDLPVGNNLYDHIMVFATFKINQSVTVTPSKMESMETVWEYVHDKKGPLTATFAEVVGHFSFDKKSSKTDVQIMVGSTLSFSELPVLKATIAKVQPKSVGNLRLKSSDPFDSPLIDPHFLEHPDDLKDTIKGCKLLLEWMSTQALSKYNPTIYAKGTVCEGKEGEDYCKCAIENFSSSMFHTSGTARMSIKNTDGVVSPSLKVWGVENLRVIDNSIMPSVTSGNTNAPAIMIGEKGSDIIKNYWNVTSSSA